MERNYIYRSLLFSALFVCFFLVTFIPSTQARASDVSISATDLKIAEPGELVTHVFTVRNEGSSSDTYELTLELPEGWTSLPVTDQVSLAPDENKPVFVNINVPESAKAGKYEITMAAESTTGTEKATRTTYIQVKSVPSVEVDWVVEPPRVGPGGSGEGRIEITNTGNLTDTYEIEITVEENWDYTVEKEKVQLLPGQSRTINIYFSVPDGARSGERYRVEIALTSTKRPELEKTLTSTGSLAPPPPEKVPDALYPTWDTTFDTSVNQQGDPTFYFGGRGDIPNVGEVSSSLSFDIEGFNGGSLRVMKENWGFSLDSSSISGSYLGVSGSPLFIGDFSESRGRVLFTEEAKAISLEQEGEYWDVRGVLGTEEEEFSFAELQGVYEFGPGQVLDGLITTAESGGESGTIIEAGLLLAKERIEMYPSFVKVYSGYPNQLPSQEYGVDVDWEEEEFTSNFNWDYSRTRIGEGTNSYHSSDNSFSASTSIDLGEELDSNFSLSWTERTSDDEPQTTDLVSRTFSGSLSGGETFGWSIGGRFTETRDRAVDTKVNTQSINAGLDFELHESEHTISTSFNRTSGPFYDNYSNTFTLTSSFPEVPLSPTFSLSKGSTDTVARINVSETSAEDLSINLAFSKSLAQQDSFSLSFTASFPGLFRFAGTTKGQVEGWIFVDENGNGRRDEGEEGVSRALLSLDGRSALSGDSGKFAFPPVSPGEYEVGIEEVETGLKPTIETPVSVRVEAGERPVVEIPLQPRSWVRGLVFDDENQNGRRDQGESGMGGIEISIMGKGEKMSVRSGSNGRFVVDLTPGTYQLELQEESLPERYEPTTPARVSV
ncbi:MAG: SdrD B-like domain-containing protein, partial [Candidatus Bipolaricaulota bacterium]